MLKGIPFDSPLYEIDPEKGIEYNDCKGIVAFFTIKNDIKGLLPEGLEPYSIPSQGGIWIAHYQFSTVGEYYEYLTVVQVRDPSGEIGYYIPYIYVTNDAALAAGREVAGAPKKLANIKLYSEYDIIQGILERPSGKRLVTFTMKPNFRIVDGFLDAILPKPVLLYSVRHLPPINGKGGVTQLIKWSAEISIHKDSDGEKIAFTGPASITYDSPSFVDPVHKIEIQEILTSLYIKFDMKLKVIDIIKEYNSTW
ncbi:MAG: acetoacetate decarboxylase family protein [Thermoprotei archaeon]|jgi:acetoacetate decarboxylase